MEYKLNTLGGKRFKSHEEKLHNEVKDIVKGKYEDVKPVTRTEFEFLQDKVRKLLKK